MPNESKLVRTITGTVVSDKMDQTIVVVTSRKVKHKVGKYVLRTTKVHAHDPENKAKWGDHVVVKECPPKSKTKSWELLEIQESSK